MNVRQVGIPMIDGAIATLAVPEPVTLERIDALEAASAGVFESLRREALPTRGRDAGTIEYESWFSIQ